ncbi:MAG TPA: TAXI family TRAP transporter solute-binding subunit [Pseudolabrys sp.]|nr:TAXI family TRAP transporter solute-binding subunit [Pseudolabrys sp.]
MHRMLAAATFAISLAFAQAASAQPVGLGTSPQGTLTYAVGAAVAKTLTEAGHIQARVQPSSGTGAMIPLVNSGEIDLGFANTLELYDAFHGVGTFDKRPNPNLRTLAVIFPIKVGLFVRADSPIKTIADMKGHTVAYGFTSQEIIKKTVDAMLATEGLSIKDLKPVMVPNLVRGVDEFIGGRADITTFALGSAKVSEADAAVGGIRFISLKNTPEALKGLKSEFRTAYIAEAKPSPRYAGVKEPINIMQYDYTIFAGAKYPAAQAKKITELLATNKDALGASHPLFKSMEVNRMFTDIEVPYHDGAKAYYAEKGIKEVK